VKRSGTVWEEWKREERKKEEGKNITIYKIISEKLNGRSRNALPIFLRRKDS
jgi:glucose-6-phosphate-specific signal transduction histidine kinase